MNIKLFSGVLFLGTASIITQASPPQNGCTRHDNFPRQCNPFSTSQAHPVDSACGLEGDATEPGEQAQDKAKNNLCASGTPHELTLAELGKLQKGVDDTNLAFGNRHVHTNLPPPPADRETFFEKEKASGFGEGDPVFFVGFIVETKLGNPESVNCHCTGAKFNDIHIELAALHSPRRVQKVSWDSPQRHKLPASPRQAVIAGCRSLALRTAPADAAMRLQLDLDHLRLALARAHPYFLINESHKPLYSIEDGLNL
jgi:hypothetical protein